MDIEMKILRSREVGCKSVLPTG